MHEAGKQTSDLRSIKFCISGAAPLPQQVQADFEAAAASRRGG
jgi:long-chain acyl-CoA synthetase